MAGLRDVSGSDAKRAFEQAGWVERKRTARKAKGSHLWILKKDGNPNHLSITNKSPLGIGLLLKLIRAAGMTREEFEALLDK